MPEVKDIYPNQAYLKVEESAANTLTFDQLLTGISIHEKVAYLISRIDYWMSVSAASFAASNDIVHFGISVSDQITSVGPEQNACVDVNRLQRTDFGAAASGFLTHLPWVKNFSELPGGGLLVPPNPLFVFVQGENAPNAFTIEARMFYTVKSLKTEDFWELVEIRRMIGT